MLVDKLEIVLSSQASTLLKCYAGLAASIPSVTANNTSALWKKSPPMLASLSSDKVEELNVATAKLIL